MAIPDLEGPGKYISNFDASAPDGQVDRGYDLDDMIRGIQNCLLLSLPEVDGPINVAVAEFNHLAGVTDPIQDQINAITANILPATTGQAFIQSTAPTGWTQDATHNDRYLRVRSAGGGGGTGGSHSVSGLTVAPHGHSGSSVDIDPPIGNGTNFDVSEIGGNSVSRVNHDHNGTVSIANSATLNVLSNNSWRVSYLDVIYCTKNAFTVP